MQVENGIGHGFPFVGGNQGAIAAARNLAFVGAIAVKQTVQNTGAPRVGQKLPLIPNQSPRRRNKGNAGFPAPTGAHVHHFGLAHGHFFHHHAGEFFINVGDDLFIGFFGLSILGFAQQNAGAGHGHFKALAPHGFNQNAQLQFPPSGDLKGIFAGGFGHADGHVPLVFRHQAFANHGGGQLFPLRPRQGGIIHAEGDGHGGGVNGGGLNGLAHRCICHRIGNRGHGHARDTDDIAGLG